MTLPTAVPTALAVSPFLTPLVEGSVHLVDLVSTPTQAPSLTVGAPHAEADQQPAVFLHRQRLLVVLATTDPTTPLAGLTAHEYFGADQTHVFVDKVDTSGLSPTSGLARALVKAYLQATAAALASSAWYLHVYAKSAPVYLFPGVGEPTKHILADRALTHWWQSAIDQALWGHPLERFCFAPSGAPAATVSNAWASGFPAALYLLAANPQTCILDLPDHELARLAKSDTAQGVATMGELLQVWSGLVEAKGGNEHPACLTVQVLPQATTDGQQEAASANVATQVDADTLMAVVKTMLAHKWGAQHTDAAKALLASIQAAGVALATVNGTKVPTVHKVSSPAKQAPVAVNTLGASLVKKKRTAAEQEEQQTTSPNKKAKVE